MVKQKRLSHNQDLKPDEIKPIMGGIDEAYQAVQTDALKPKTKFSTQYNPDGSVLQTEEGTGKMTQIVPRQPQGPTPTNEDKAITDRLATMKLPDTPQNRDRVRTILLNEKTTARKRYREI